MRGKKAKALRRANLAAGIPANGRTTGPNITDLEDTREDRRLKTFRKRQYQAMLDATDPKGAEAKMIGFFRHVYVWLMLPAYREGFGNPTKGWAPEAGSTWVLPEPAEASPEAPEVAV